MTIFFFKRTHQKYSHLNADCCHPTSLTGLLAPSEMLALSHSCQGIGLALIVLLSVCHLHSINEDFLWAECSAGLWRQKDEEWTIPGGPDHRMPFPRLDGSHSIYQTPPVSLVLCSALETELLSVWLWKAPAEVPRWLGTTGL